MTWPEIGAPSALYWSFSDDQVDLCIGFALEKTIGDRLIEEQGMTKHTIPSGTYLKCISIGPYDQMSIAWAKTFEHLKSIGVERDDSLLGLESYMNDPSTVKPEDLQTDIYIKISEKRKREKEPVTAGGFCHMDIFYENKERVQKFYDGMFGWTFMDWKDEYFMFRSPSGVDGGFVKGEIQKKPSVVSYIQVDSIDLELYHKVELFGGKIVGDQVIIENHGGYVPFTDSEGNHFAFWTGKITKIDGYRSK